MKLQTAEIIKELNERVINQGIVIQTLIDLLVNNGVISEKELDLQLIKNTEEVNDYLDNLHEESDSDTFDLTNFYGTIGEA